MLDLFDTLVDLSLADLPRLTVAGRELPTTAGAVHAALRPHLSISFEDFAAALAAVDRDLRAAYWGQGRELPTPLRFAHLLARLGASDPEGTLADALTRAHMDLLVGIARTPAHHPAVLDRLRGRVRLGLCSNWSWSPAAHRILAGTGLRERLDALAISHDVGVRKPRAELFAAALDALGVAPGEAIHVGDDLRADVEGAAALGLRTVWITRRVADPGAARASTPGARPDWVVRDLAELEAIVAGERA
ncbi:MAG: HAD family hydrolase [Deltaproteobacteria bacterium]|nr:HAD family hydrolase [Deltaproteobacteria bacterium]